MSNNSNGCCNECDSLGLPVGEQGENGQPAFVAISCFEAGQAYATNSIAYQPVREFTFSNVMGNPLTAYKANIFMTGGTGSIRIKDRVSGLTIDEFSVVSSTSDKNIETRTGFSAYPSAGAIILIEVKSNTGGLNFISIGSISFYYS